MARPCRTAGWLSAGLAVGDAAGSPAAAGSPGRTDPAEVADHGQPEGRPEQQDDQWRGDVVAAEVEDLADESDGVLRREQHADVPPVGGQQVGPGAARSGAAQDYEGDHDQQRAHASGEALDARGGQYHRRRHKREAWQQRPEMARGVRADPEPGDQVGQHRADDGIADQDGCPPARSRGPFRGLEYQHGSQVAADEQGKQEQSHHCADPVPCRQRLDGLDGDRLVQLVRDGQERGLHFDLAEEALGRNHDERVAGRAGHEGSVNLPLVDRGERRGLARVQHRGQRYLRLHSLDHQRRPDHAEWHLTRRQQLLGADQAQRQQALQNEHSKQGRQDLPQPARLTRRLRRRCFNARDQRRHRLTPKTAQTESPQKIRYQRTG